MGEVGEERRRAEAEVGVEGGLPARLAVGGRLGPETGAARSWCPSCTNRRAVETGVRLAALLPWVRHRQWTLSLPFKLKLPGSEAAKSCSSASSCGWCGRCGGGSEPSPDGWECRAPSEAGRSSSRKWFGSSLQVTPHLHALVAEAMWTPGGELVELPAKGRVAASATAISVTLIEQQRMNHRRVQPSART